MKTMMLKELSTLIVRTREECFTIITIKLKPVFAMPWSIHRLDEYFCWVCMGCGLILTTLICRHEKQGDMAETP